MICARERRRPRPIAATPHGERSSTAPATSRRRSSRASSRAGSSRASSTPSRRAAPDENYSIAIPPPNVTGALHMGHALNGSVQDALIRYHRMRGQAHEVDPRHRPRRHRDADARSSGCSPREGTSREEIGREAFVERVWRWREEYGGRSSTSSSASAPRCDYEDERFTLDDGYVRAVLKVFVDALREGPDLPRQLHGQLGPGHCARRSPTSRSRSARSATRCTRSTTRSRRGDGALTVATVRPETMLADTAIAVHPDDERYTRAGRARRRSCRSSGGGCRSSPTTYVKPEFGTGALKITPGPRPERLRDRPRARPRGDHGDRRGRPHERAPRASASRA